MTLAEIWYSFDTIKDVSKQFVSNHIKLGHFDTSNCIKIWYDLYQIGHTLSLSGMGDPCYFFLFLLYLYKQSAGQSTSTVKLGYSPMTV